MTAEASHDAGVQEGVPRAVLFLHRGGNQIRGSEEALLTLLSHIDRNRFRPIMVCSSENFASAVSGLGIPTQVGEFPEIILGSDEMKFPIARYVGAVRKLARLCRDERVQLVFASGGGPCQIGVPLAKLAQLPSLCLFHHPAPRRYHSFWLTRHVNTIVFTSRFTRDHTRELIGRTGDVAYIGIDKSRFHPVPTRNPTLRLGLGIKETDVVFAQIGALVPLKGHDILIDAFARARKQVGESIRLVIIGAGPEKERITARAKEIGLGGGILLTGYVEDIVPYYQHVIDVNVLASLEEGFGLVNVQASMSRLPNLASDNTGIRETIVHDQTGFLFSSGSVADLADYMIRLAQDSELRARLGNAGYEWATPRFDPGQFALELQKQMTATCRSCSPQPW